ncbi:hypothetical protein GY45DRAFT_214130 [Cubamyces sp. BRFM 1775]|nr:hypothetical protein GY45DRAFT_214130 [Cubamyces sp. BRFM 1775]
MGPLPRDLSSPLHMSSSPRHLYDQLFTVSAPLPREPRFFNYVDVHDVVEAHIHALEVEAAGGERFLVSSLLLDVCSWQDWHTSSRMVPWGVLTDAANALGVLPKLDEEDHDAAGDVPSHPTSSGEKAKQILGIKFKALPETFKGVYEQWSALS